MFYKLIALLIVSAFYGSVFAQEGHLLSFDEVLEQMEISSTKYKIDRFQYNGVSSKRIIAHSTFPVRDKHGPIWKNRSTSNSSRTQKYISLGLESIDSEEFEDAIIYFKKALQYEPGHVQVLGLLAKCNFELEDYEAAQYWILKALKKDRNDYFVHWLRAKMYLKQGALPNALNEIAVAHFLNRNHSGIYNELKMIFRLNNLILDTSEFIPACKIEVKGDEVLIQAESVWLAYAMTKAHREVDLSDVRIADELTFANQSISREVEALSALLMVFQEMTEEEQLGYEAIRRFERAIHANRVKEFIIYELMLPQNPGFLAWLNPGLQYDLLQYLKEVCSLNSL